MNDAPQSARTCLPSVPLSDVRFVNSRSCPRGQAALVATAYLLMALPAAGQSAQPTNSSQADLPKINTEGWTSANVCGECHQAIHAVWQQSLHANSWTNGVFQAAYHRGTDAYGADKTKVCLGCHTPTVRRGGDYAVKNPVTAEGIGCDFCHSVKGVDLDDKEDPFRITVGRIKYGPLRHAQSPAHQIVNSELHTRSEFCAGCHEYKNAAGASVLSTYSEWKSSSYAKRGTQCQDCHMPLVPGSVVALRVMEKSPKQVNLHDVSGSHDIERVRKAIKLDVEGYEWLGDRVWVYIKVTNKGSGHCFPTGLPMHRAVLEVLLENEGNDVARREIPFQMVMEDAQGRALTHEYEVFVKAARIRDDTRIKPNEERMIDIPFRNITAHQLTMTATLYYKYSTEARVVDKEGARYEPVEMKFLVASRQSILKPPGGR